jgi:beta-phosphoglucomutase-like phosphatase (HAD superfamily)
LISDYTINKNKISLIKNEIKAIIFDLDGVLWDTSIIHFNSYNAALKTCNLTMHDYKIFAGMKTEDAIKNLLLKNNKESYFYLIPMLAEKKRLLARKELLNSVDKLIKADTLFVLKKLKEKYLIGLATSSSKISSEIFLNHVSENFFFDVCVNGDDLNNLKPDPEIYLKVIKDLNLLNAECLVIEDSISGMISAQKSGLKCIGLVGTHSYLELSKMNLFAIISDIRELSDGLLN